MKLLYIDLFCGAGGTSTGVETAKYEGDKCAKVIACVNHDENAIASHASNHPEALHFTEEIPEAERLMLDVDISNIYSGKLSGFILDGVIRLKKPSLPYNKIPNWPVDGYILKDTIEVSKEHIKRWKIIGL